MRGVTIRSAYARCGLLAMLLSAALLVALPNGATAQDGGNSVSNSGNTNVQYQNQNCTIIIQQYNQAVAGDAIASGDGAIAEVAAEVNAPINVVQQCINGNNNTINNGGGTTAPPEETTGPERTVGNENTRPEDSTCPSPTVVATIGPTTENDQRAFSTTGDRFRVTYEVDFVDAEEFNSLEIDVDGEFFFDGELIFEDQSGSFVVTEGPGDYTVTTRISPDDAGTYTVTIEDCTGQATGTPTTSTPESSVIAATIPDKVLANTGGATVGLIAGIPASAVLIPAGAFLIASGLGTALLIRRSPGGRG